jgi:protein-disulfide isomerase
MRHAALIFGMASALLAQSPLIEGKASSSVRVVIWEDLQCPDCADFRKMMDKDLLPRFAASVRFEHRDFPLAKHAWARPAAIAARYFESVSPDLAVEFRKITMAQQEHITPETFPAHLTSFARAHNVDPDKATASLRDAALSARVQQDVEEGVARGIAHTPSVLVNGEPFIETFPVEDIIKAIERELAAK